jgi:hypothetical protein
MGGFKTYFENKFEGLVELVTTASSEIYKMHLSFVFKMFHENNETMIYKE